MKRVMTGWKGMRVRDLIEIEGKIKNFMSILIKRFHRHRYQKMLWNTKKSLRGDPPL